MSKFKRFDFKQYSALFHITKLSSASISLGLYTSFDRTAIGTKYLNILMYLFKVQLRITIKKDITDVND